MQILPYIFLQLIRKFLQVSIEIITYINFQLKVDQNLMNTVYWEVSSVKIGCTFGGDKLLLYVQLKAYKIQVVSHEIWTNSAS